MKKNDFWGEFDPVEKSNDKVIAAIYRTNDDDKLIVSKDGKDI